MTFLASAVFCGAMARNQQRSHKYVGEQLHPKNTDARKFETFLRKDEDAATMLANFCVRSRNVAEGQKSASEAVDAHQLTLNCDGDAQDTFPQ